MLLVLIPSLTSFSNYGYFYSDIVPVHNSDLTLAYTSHAPITITSDSDFETQSWPGGGILTNPYLISGLNITSSSPVHSITTSDSEISISSDLVLGGKLF